MKKIYTLIVFAICFMQVQAQTKYLDRKIIDKITDSISTEANELYKSEFASWYGTDIFVAQCPARRVQTGGYLSYDSGQGLNNIFFSKGDNPVVLATISFGYNFNTASYKLDTTTRNFIPIEKSLYNIRKAALAEIYANKDSLFLFYKNTSLNPVPIIKNNSKKVYVLTGPETNGIVMFGNDYLLTFDKNDNLINKKRLHKNLISVKYSKMAADSGKTGIISMHTHLPETGDFIGVTDICTLRLYEKFTTWTQHYVMSKDYISLWDCTKDRLVILTREAWDKINSYKSPPKDNSH